ncbi:MAG: hypothetical protein KIH69_000825 [Anaerolineae bacterium]|nr:hypothetical protein [Anaerolineae bacterium]
MATYFAAAALLMVCVAFVLSPLLEKKRPALAAPTAFDALELERQAVVRVIRELDEDYRVGKVSEGDYQALRATQMQRGAEILHDIEQLRSHKRPLTAQESELEKEILALRHKKH